LLKYFKGMVQVFEPRFIWLERVDSTNSYCIQLAEKGEPEGLVVAAYFQEQGRGQRGNTWDSDEGMNLTFSILLRPTFMKAEEQFEVSKVIALSICDWLKINGIEACIKWPNDIYVGEKKIAGILIENSFSSSQLDVSVVGIGLNLNQTIFSPKIPNPTSMKLIKGIQYRPEIVLRELLVSIQMRYLQLKYGLSQKVADDYLKTLFRFETFSSYSRAGELFKAKIIGIKPTGELILETEQGEQKSYGFKEVYFEI
jgi:BirA family biotin operon repressor/biotin-[acetyl-CoA-carboxylase] ligase